MTDTKPRLGAGRRRTVQGISALLVAIVIGFVVLRLLIDVPELAAGTLPEEEYDRRFVEHPLLAYLHLAPGILYLVGAPFQLAYRVRSKP